MSTKTVRSFALGIVCGAFLTAGIVAAAPAHADPTSMAYAASMGEPVCNTLSDYPSYGGITGIGKAITEDGLTLDQASEVIVMSVINLCPQHMPLLRRYADQYSADVV